MILVNSEKCNLCGLCIKICHESCIHTGQDTVVIDHRYCSTCSQCIAICPEKAITWNGLEPEPYDKSNFPTPESLGELFMERRTIRDYRGKKIDRALLEEIAGYAAYAPTHDFNLRLVIIDNEAIIDLADRLIYRFSMNIYRWLYKPKIIHTFIKLVASSSEFEYLKAKPKLENVKKRKHGFKTKPAAIILIVGDRGVPFSLESAQYALYNMDLYAQVNGLASRNLVGNQMILNRSKDFRKSAGIGGNERIVGAMTLGYGSVKFRNKVMGKDVSIRWV